MLALCIAVIGGISAAAVGSSIAWVLGGITAATIALGFAVAGSAALPAASIALILVICGYNLGLFAGLVLKATYPVSPR
jgi:hypothetical protein